MARPPAPSDPLTGPLDARRKAMAERRQRCPVARLEPRGDSERGPWYVARQAGVREGLTNADHFVGSFGNHGDLPEEETILPAIAEPRHGRIRKLVNSVLGFHHASPLESFVRSFAGELLDTTLAAARRDGRVDLCATFARPLPSGVIARVLGVPADDVELFARWSDEVLERQSSDDSRNPTLGDLHPEFAAYVDAQIDSRRSAANPPNDLVTRLLDAEVEGERLSPRAVRTQIMNLIIAGNETTRNLIGNLLERMAADGALFATLRADPALVATAIEECLRLDSPVQLLARSCTRALEIAGQPIAAGERVLFGLASANRDADRYGAPDDFRLDRDGPREHVAFGAGPHVCPGAFLARMETRVAVETLLERVASMQLVPDRVADPSPVFWALGPKTLPVRISVA